MSTQPQLHSSIVAMVSLASGIASRHPDMGLCQLDKLKAAGIPEHQINSVIEIARHIREEASQKIDATFDKKAALNQPETIPDEPCCDSSETVEVALSADSNESCCSTTVSGQSCC